MCSPAFLPTMVFKVSMDCCDACPKRVKKSLSKIDGVYSVVVDAERNLVSVEGKADPAKMLKAISKLRKSAELLSYEKHPQKTKKCCQTADETIHGKCCHKKKGSDRNNGCCCGDEYGAKNAHRSEYYTSPLFDARICRDPFCVRHKRWPFVNGFVSSGDYGGYHQNRSPFDVSYSGMKSFSYIGDQHGRGCTIM